MIQARQVKWFQWGFHQYNKQLISRSFHRVWLANDSVRPPAHAMFIANHSSWWDGLLCFHLNRELLGHTSYYMMHESGLKRFPFFRHLGAFSVNRDKPKDIMEALRYAVTRLENKESVWIFPQGDEKHLELRPLSFLPGFLYVAEKLPQLPIVPVTYYYSFRHERKPEIFMKIGAPFYLQELQGTSRIQRLAHAEQLFTTQLNKLKEQVVLEKQEQFTSFEKWKW